MLSASEADTIQPMVDSKKTPKGRRITQAIKMSGKTQKEIADILGVKPQSVGKWVVTGNITTEHLKRLAEVTGANLHYLISGRSSLRVSEADVAYYAKHRELHDLVERLTQKQAKQLMLFAQTLLDEA